MVVFALGSEDMEYFGTILKRRIKEEGFSKFAFAEALGVSDAMIHHYLNGRSYPRPMNLEKLCRLLSLDYEAMERLIAFEKEKAVPGLRPLFDTEVNVAINVLFKRINKLKGLAEEVCGKKARG